VSDVAIWVEGFSTRYRIGPRERYKALRDIITDAFVAPFRGLRENWPFAIRNPQFEIETGSRRPALGAPFPRFSQSHFLTLSLCPCVPQNEQGDKSGSVPHLQSKEWTYGRRRADGDSAGPGRD